MKKKSEKKMKRTTTVCLSHKEDADGICSAALIKAIFGGDSILVDYPGQMDSLEKLKHDKTLKKLFICDLGLNKKNQDVFIEIMTELKNNGISITYIDHHDASASVITRLTKLKINVIHDIKECTTVQVYDKYKRKLSGHFRFLAACASITDYMDDRKKASQLLQIYDRQFTLINATVLTYNIVGHQKDPDYLLYLVDELSNSKYPHQIPNSFEFAQIQVEKLSLMIDKIKKNMKKMSNLGYVEIFDSGASGAVNFVLGLSDKNVGVAYKERSEHGVYAVSIRGSKSCKFHLGRIMNNIASKCGGSGGGHKNACGAVIPKSKIKKFLRELNRKLV